MIREVCLYDKFSFCKNGVKCMRVHLKEVCQIRACDYRNATRGIQDHVQSSVSMVSVGLAPVAGTATGLLRKWKSRTR